LLNVGEFDNDMLIGPVTVTAPAGLAVTACAEKLIPALSMVAPNAIASFFLEHPLETNM
jgi:hypothetical protein